MSKLVPEAVFTGAQPQAGTGHKMQSISVVFSTLHCEGYIADLRYRWLITSVSARWLIEFYPPFWKARGMEDSQQKDYSFLGNDTFPSLYDARVYERKFKSEYLERQFYERLLKNEPSIEKLSENKSDLSKLSTLSEASIVKFIENQSEHLSKLTFYHLKKRARRWSRRACEPSRIPLLFLRGLNGIRSTRLLANSPTIKMW